MIALVLLALLATPPGPVYVVVPANTHGSYGTRCSAFQERPQRWVMSPDDGYFRVTPTVCLDATYIVADEDMGPIPPRGIWWWYAPEQRLCWSSPSGWTSCRVFDDRAKPGVS